MSGFTFFAPTTVAKTTVSPHWAIIAPSACLAIFPVSKLIFFPCTSIGNNFLKIRKKIISNIKRLNWKNGFYRSDIGWKVINKNENYKRYFKR